MLKYVVAITQRKVVRFKANAGNKTLKSVLRRPKCSGKLQHEIMMDTHLRPIFFSLTDSRRKDLSA